MDTYGFHGDTFSGGFGDFHPAKRQQQYRLPFDDAGGFGQIKTHPFFFQNQKMKVYQTNKTTASKLLKIFLAKARNGH